MISTIGDQIQEYTSEQLRSLVTTLSKNGTQKIAQSTPILSKICALAQNVIQEKQSMQKSFTYVTELFLLTAKVLTGMQGLPEESLAVVDSTLSAISESCSLLFKKYSHIPAGEVLVLITDSKKSIFYQQAKKQQDGVRITVTDPAGTFNNSSLDVIKESPEESVSLCQSDLMMSQSIFVNNLTVVKRQDMREGYIQMVGIVLKSLEGIQKQLKDRPLQFVHKYIDILVNVMRAVTTQHLIQIFKNLRQSLWQYFTHPDENTLRNITKESIESLITALQLIFNRLDLEQQKYKWLQTFIAQTTLPLIRCQLLKKKSIGTKMLGEICSTVFIMRAKYLKDSEHKSWLIKNRVFQEIFTLDTHEQIMEAGGDILKFLVKSNALEESQLYVLLNILEKGDINLRKILSKIMYDLTLRYDYKQTNIMLLQMKRMPSSIFNEDMVKIVADISRYSTQKHKLMGIDIFQKLIFQYYSNFNANIQQQLFSRYIDLVKNLLEKSIGNMNILSYFQKISNKPLQTHSIELMRKFLDMLPDSKQESKYYQFQKTTFDVAAYLIEQQLIHERLIEIANTTSDIKRRNACSNFLISIVKIYKQRSEEDKYIPIEMLQKLTSHSKVFCQLLYSYKNQNFEELFIILISQPISGIQHLSCLKELFYFINRSNMIKVVCETQSSYEINVIPEELSGFKNFMSLVLEAEQQNIREEAAQFVCQLYSHLSPDLSDKKNQIIKQFVESLLENIKKFYEKKQDNKLLGYLCLIQAIMNETETKGVGNLIAHSSLVNLQSVKISIVNQITFGYDIPRTCDSKFASNITLFEMLIQVSKVFKCSPQDFILKLGDQEIKPIYNGLTIQELGLKDKTLIAYKRNRESIPKVELLNYNNKLTQPAIKVFGSIFQKFSTNGQMKAPDAARFVQASTNDSCSINDYRVIDLFSKHDHNKDGILQLEGFLAFWEDSTRAREQTVWRNLEALRIRPDLKRYEDVKQQLDYNLMARYIIYFSDVYDLLFAITKNQKLKQKSIKLLKRLPTSKKIIQQILQNINFEDKDEFISWYKLTLIEWMIHDKLDNKTQIQLNKQNFSDSTQRVDNDIRDSKGIQPIIFSQIIITTVKSQKQQWQQSPQKIERNNSHPDITHIDTETINQWKQKFVTNRMYIKIVEQAESIANASLNLISSIRKTCLLLCLQILRRLCKVPELQKTLPVFLTTAKQEIQLISLPQNKLAQKLIPQLFEGQMNTELLQPLLCLLLEKKDLELNLISPGLFCFQKQVRVMTNNFLYLHQVLHNYNLNIQNIEPMQQCQQFFNILVKILIEDDKIKLQDVFDKTYEEIKSHNVKQYIGSKFPDYLLQGKLNILNNILVVMPEIHLGEEIQKTFIQKLHQALFPTTRQTLFNILLKTKAFGIIRYLSTFIELVEPKKPSTIRNNYVGLYNLGCTCYMNSMLQQFYMTSDFKSALVGIDGNKTIEVKQKKGKKYKDNILYQLQKMFAYLDLSQRGEYNPQHFCYSFKSDINVGIQQDSQQFLGSVFSKIQTELKDTCFSDLIDRIYGGKTIVTIRCSRCDKEKHRVQEFNNLQLQVKDHKSLDQSLIKFTTQESINDYLCEFCKAEGIIKSTNIYKLPNVLIVHLMRMVFDVQTYERVKLHNKLQFPNDLNLRKYIKVPEGQQLPNQSQCQYVLKGVVIHSGCAESGHYYSLIKSEAEWYKFDDSRVTSFKMNDLSDEAFGGKQQYNDWGVTGSTRSKNAYMLIYEKVIKTPWIITKQITKEEKQNMQMMAEFEQRVNQVQNKPKAEIIIKKFKGFINRDLQQDIIQDHKVLFHQLQFYQEAFFKFVKGVIEKINIRKQYFDQIIKPESKPCTSQSEMMTPNQKQQCICALQFIFKLIQFLTKSPNPDANLIKTIIPYLDILLFILPDQAEEYFMNINNTKYFEVIISHADNSIRDVYRSILNRCFNIILHKRQIKLNDQKQSCLYKNKLLKLLEDALSLLYTQVPKNPTKLAQYFEFWKIFSFSRKDCMQYCFQKNFISLMIDFLMQKKSPIMLNPGNYSLSKYSSPSIGPLLQMVAGLVINSNYLFDTQSLQEDRMYILTNDDKKCLTDINFYKFMIQQKQDFTGLIHIINRLVYRNLPFSQQIAVFLMNGINKTERYEFALAYMMIINGYLAVDDEYYRQRLQWVLGVPQLIESSYQEYSIKSSIRSQNVRYLSSIFASKPDYYKSVLELLYSQRRNPDSFSVTGVSILLDLLTRSDKILQYVIGLPPPSYCYAKYTDWIPSFVDSFQKDKSIILMEDKDRVAERCYNSLINIYERTKKMISERRQMEQIQRQLDEQWDNQRNQPEQQKIKEKQIQEKEDPFQIKGEQNDVQQIKLEHNPYNVEVETLQVINQENKSKQQQSKEHYKYISQQNKNQELKPLQNISEEDVLPSLYPLTIIGVTQRLQQIGWYSVEQAQKKIQLSGYILHTYTLKSRPTGDNNLSLSKDLFEQQSNYKQKPLKFFVDGDNQLLPDNDDLDIPQVKPTVIHIKIDSNAQIVVTSKNPQFNYSYYFTQGIHVLNIPYQKKQIDQLLQFRFQNFQCGDVVQKKDEGIQSGGPVYYGPSPQFQNNLGQNWDFNDFEKEIMCPTCTFINTRGTSLCEVCQSSLHTIL